MTNSKYSASSLGSTRSTFSVSQYEHLPLPVDRNGIISLRRPRSSKQAAQHLFGGLLVALKILRQGFDVVLHRKLFCIAQSRKMSSIVKVSEFFYCWCVVVFCVLVFFFFFLFVLC